MVGELTDREAEDGCVQTQQSKRLHQEVGQEGSGHSSTDEGNVIDCQCIHPRHIRHPTTEDSAGCVRDSNDCQQKNRFVLSNAEDFEG